MNTNINSQTHPRRMCYKQMNIPDGFICIGYKLVYGNLPFNPEASLYGLPLYDVIHYVIERQNAVQYTLGSKDDQDKLIDEFHSLLRFTPKYNLKLARKKYSKFFLFDNMATLLFIMLATEYCDNSSRSLTDAEIERIYQTYLYCNDYWSGKQEKGIEPLIPQKNLPGMYLMADIPIIEFKFHKDFKSQLFKGGQLFMFMESNEPYKTYLNMFYKEQNIADWKNYIELLLSFYTSTIDKCIVQVDEQNSLVRPFFDSLCIDLTCNEGRSLWTNKNIMYLREHPLLKAKDSFYLVINPNLIIDRIYQSLKFDIFEAMITNNALNKNGKPIKQRTTFFSMLGNDFSEHNIFYSVIEKAFSGIATKMYSGIKLKEEGVIAEPDYYVRIGDSLLLFEYKDVTLSDDVKQSYDYEMVKNAILGRLCKDDGTTRKGVGQLLFTANEIMTNKSMLNIDPDSLNVKRIYPIVVTTDRSFNSMGVQHLIIEAASTIINKYSIPSYISNPFIIDSDDILFMSKKISDGQIDFISLLDEYNIKNERHLSSFNTYLLDHHRNSVLMREDDMRHIFSELMDNVEHQTEKKQ